ncbi:MAG: hypothetical protein WAM39_06400 [Bryobacteraceae bacterium]
MTGIIAPSRRNPIGLHAGIFAPEFEPAFSADTKLLARQVDALRRRLSPTSFHQQLLPRKDLAERLFDALASAKQLTASVAMHLDRARRDKLFRQLDSLHDLAEWEEGDEPLQQSSFGTFLKAMLAVNPQRQPGLGLSHVGHLIGAWTVDRDRLTIEFLPNDWVKWVLGRYKEDEEPRRFAGQTPVSELTEGLAPYQPEHWFSHEEGRQREESPR